MIEPMSLVTRLAECNFWRGSLLGWLEGDAYFTLTLKDHILLSHKAGSIAICIKEGLLTLAKYVLNV